jgi:hypothetical protein
MAHGTFNPQQQFYCIILIKCEQNILNNIFDKGYHAKMMKKLQKLVKLLVIEWKFILIL